MELNQSTNLNQTQEQKQKLVMTPQLQQAIELLQFSSLELKEHILKEMMDNPVLELEDNYDSLTGGYSSGGEEINYEEFVAEQLTLNQHLKQQVKLSFEGKRQKIGEEIIGSLDEAGYFTAIEEVEEDLEVSRREIKDVLKKVQRFDPVGIAASGPQESLLVQLDEMKDEKNRQRIEAAKKIVDKYWEELKDNKVRKIASGVGLKPEVCQKLVDLIKSFTARPRDKFKGGNNAKYLEPDIIIKSKGDDYIIIMREESFPTVKLNNYYRNLLKQGKLSGQEGDYLEDKLKSAIWLVKSIEQRRQTIYNIVEEIVELQQKFLERGVKYLQPVTMKEVADRIDMHESTVSRASTDKSIQTPQGLFPMKFFFCKGIECKEGEVAAVSVKKELKELVAEEDKTKPLSDRKLADKLEEREIGVSRRTVAKYRKELGIPSSRKRKRYE